MYVQELNREDTWFLLGNEITPLRHRDSIRHVLAGPQISLPRFLLGLRFEQSEEGQEE